MALNALSPGPIYSLTLLFRQAVRHTSTYKTAGSRVRLGIERCYCDIKDRTQVKQHTCNQYGLSFRYI